MAGSTMRPLSANVVNVGVPMCEFIGFCSFFVFALCHAHPVESLKGLEIPPHANVEKKCAFMAGSTMTTLSANVVNVGVSMCEFIGFCSVYANVSVKQVVPPRIELAGPNGKQI